MTVAFNNPILRRKAFTLGEMLIVASTLVVLAVAVIPRFLGNTGSPKTARADGDLATFNKQLHLFKQDTGRYPTTEEGLAALRNAPEKTEGWNGPYLEKDLANDPWNHPYIYQYPGLAGKDSFLLESAGPTGDPDAKDAIIESQ